MTDSPFTVAWVSDRNRGTRFTRFTSVSIYIRLLCSPPRQIPRCRPSSTTSSTTSSTSSSTPLETRSYSTLIPLASTAILVVARMLSLITSTRVPVHGSTLRHTSKNIVRARSKNDFSTIFAPRINCFIIGAISMLFTFNLTHMNDLHLWFGPRPH